MPICVCDLRLRHLLNLDPVEIKFKSQHHRSEFKVNAGKRAQQLLGMGSLTMAEKQTWVGNCK